MIFVTMQYPTFPSLCSRELDLLWYAANSHRPHLFGPIISNLPIFHIWPSQPACLSLNCLTMSILLLWVTTKILTLNILSVFPVLSMLYNIGPMLLIFC